MEATMQTYSVQCAICNKVYEFEADPSDVKQWWEQGVHIQDALGYLNKHQRELIISRTCQDCWTEMYGLELDFEE